MKFDILLLMAAVALTAGCNIDDPYSAEIQDGHYKRIVMIMPDSEVDSDKPLTKNTAVVGTSGVDYVWDASDVVGIFPDSGSQLYFSMESGAGQKEAAFDGGGWALKEGSSYYSYFPFVADFNIRKDAIPFDYRGQQQIGNRSSATGASSSIGNYCFMAAKGEANDDGSLYFSYKRIGALFILTVPAEAGSYKSATILADSKVIPYRGTFNSITIDEKMYDTELTDTLSISLKDIELASKGNITFYMMLPPFKYQDRQFSIVTTRADGRTAVSSFGGKDFAVGKTYLRSTNFAVSPASIGINNLGGNVEINITAAGSSAYSVSTDVDWITLNSQPTSGDATLSASVQANSGYRTGHIIVSETVSPNGSPVTLQNIVTVSQNPTGYSVGIGDWDYGNREEGEVD